MLNPIRPAILLYFIFFIGNIFGQVQTPRYIPITTNTNAFYEYLPVGYSSGNETYPLIIFIGGYGENGDGSPAELPRMLDFGPPLQISQGIFPNTFLVYGQTFSFIIISPQFTKLPVPSEINDVINYAVQNYRVNENRIYLTGASMGGGVCWEYAGANSTYANRIAAMVPICGGSYPTPEKAQTIANANIHVWATHSEFDENVPSANTTGYVNLINNATNPPNNLAKATLFPGSDHNAWTPTYNLNFKEDGANVYEWMLRFSRAVVLPIAGIEFNARKRDDNKALLTWKTYTENNIRGFEIQKSKNGLAFNSIGFVNSRGFSASGASYSFTDGTPLDGKNYYRIKTENLNNTVRFSSVRFIEFNKANFVTIYPNPVMDILNFNTSYTFNKAQLKIRSISGKLVQQRLLNGSGTISILLNKLAAGIYTAEIKGGKINLKLNFIKQ